MPTTAPIAPPGPPAPPLPIQPAGGEVRILIPTLSWAGYENLLRELGDGGPRVSYLDGSAELMAPDFLHERSGNVLRQMVVDLAVELRIPISNLGSSTFKSRAARRGVEPDVCFYLNNRESLRGQAKGDLDALPPPDLVIEVEITSPLLDKLDIYAGLGVPEIWRHDGRTLTVLLLQADGKYLPADRSRAFPFLPLADFVRQMDAFDPDGEVEWIVAYRAWVRDVVAPLHQPGPRPPHGA